MPSAMDMMILKGIVLGGGLAFFSTFIYPILKFLFTEEIVNSLFISGYIFFTCVTTLIAITSWDVQFILIWLFYSLGMLLILKIIDEQRKINEDKNYVSTFCIVAIIISILLWVYIEIYL